MAAYLLDGRAVDAILALIAIEGFLLTAWRLRTGGGPPIATTIASLLAGACLLLALREALTGGAPQTIAAWLAAAFAAHGADLGGRWRSASLSRRPTSGPDPLDLTPKLSRA